MHSFNENNYLISFTPKEIEIENRVFREINRYFIFRSNRTTLAQPYGVRVIKIYIGNDIGRPELAWTGPNRPGLARPFGNSPKFPNGQHVPVSIFSHHWEIGGLFPTARIMRPKRSFLILLESINYSTTFHIHMMDISLPPWQGIMHKFCCY